MVEKVKGKSLRKGITLNTIFLIIFLTIILSFVISYAVVSVYGGSRISTDSGSVIVQVIPDLGTKDQGKIIVEIVETGNEVS